MREQIAEFLAQGYKQSQVADIMGCSPSVISELLKDEAFKEDLKERMKAQQDKRLSNKYDALEESTLTKIKEQIELCEISDLTRVLESVSRIKNANRPMAQLNQLNNPTIGITLIMPEQNIPRVITDERNQIIAIGSKSMAPMPAAHVKQMFTQMEHPSTKEEHERSERARHERNEALAAAQRQLAKSA